MAKYYEGSLGRRLKRLKAKVKGELARRRQKKAHAILAKEKNKDTTKRTRQVSGALKDAGVSQGELDKLRGKK